MSHTFETAAKIENGTVVWTETVNRVWTVRSGQDGIGLALFHVYAPDMDAARERAAENMSQISEVHKLYAERGLFTVHADDPSDVTLKAGPYDQIPAIDFENSPVTDWTEFFPERLKSDHEIAGMFALFAEPSPHPWHCQCRECAEPETEVR
jgi:hypothetical protein